MESQLHSLSSQVWQTTMVLPKLGWGEASPLTMEIGWDVGWDAVNAMQNWYMQNWYKAGEEVLHPSQPTGCVTSVGMLQGGYTQRDKSWPFDNEAGWAPIHNMQI